MLPPLGANRGKIIQSAHLSVDRCHDWRQISYLTTAKLRQLLDIRAQDFGILPCPCMFILCVRFIGRVSRQQFAPVLGNHRLLQRIHIKVLEGMKRQGRGFVSCEALARFASAKG